jgi:hypothetical protein
MARHKLMLQSQSALTTLAMMLSSLALLLELTCFGMSRQMTLILGGAAGLSVNSTALVTGVLTTTAATVHTGGITMPDNAKAIFGAGDDLEIYHDGSNSIIKDGGTGDLQIRAANFKLNNAEYTTTMLEAYVGGAVSLWYDNAAKLATTATGIDVTGTVAADGLTVDAVTSTFQSTGATAIVLKI